MPLPARSVEFPSIEPSADGWVGFNTNTLQMFDDFLTMIDRADLRGTPGLRSDPAQRSMVEDSVRAWTTQHPTADIIETASLLRIPVAPIGNGRNLVDHEHLAAREVYTTDGSGGFTYPKPPYRLNGRRPEPPRPAPDARRPQRADRVADPGHAEPSMGGVGGPSARRPQGPRLHVLVGRAGGHAVPRRPRRRRHPRRVDSAHRWHAAGRHHPLRHPRSLVGIQQLLSQHQRQQARPHPEPRRSERPGPGRAPHRMGRPGRRELHARGSWRTSASTGPPCTPSTRPR